MKLDPVVKVIEVCKIAPAANTSPAPTVAVSNSDSVNYFPVSLFDIMWLRLSPAQCVFFYQIHDPSLSVFSDDILPKLKNALSLALQHYPELAGNFTWHPDTGKPVIRFAPDEDGVFLTVAESTADFHYLSTYDVKEASVLHSLVSDLPASENQATIISVQVTLFPGYGFSIGFTFHHAALDGNGATMFFKSWAKICQVGALPLPPELTPVFDRSMINDPLDISKIITDKWKNMSPKNSFSLIEMKPAPNLFRGTFRLTREHIIQIKKKINMTTPVSSFTAVCSYVCTCLIKAEEGDITSENVFLVVPMNCRSRLEPPIPANYIGNCIAIQIATEKVVSLELVTAARAIKDAVGSLPKGAMEGAENWFPGTLSKILQGQNSYSIGGSPLFEIYGADFGWGRPIKVDLVSIDRGGTFFLCDPRDHENGGMEIGIVLSKPKIEAFASIFANGLLQEIGVYRPTLIESSLHADKTTAQKRKSRL